MKLSLIIPCLNERLALPRVRKMLSELFVKNAISKTFEGIEVLIVDDGSSDGTEFILPTWTDCQILRHETPQGYGAALKAGFSSATGDVVGFMDMDSSYVPSEFIKMGTLLSERNLMCVYGSRTRQVSGMPSIRKLGNRLYADALKALCGSNLSDVCTGQRLFRRDLLPLALSLPENDLSYSVALTVAMLSSKVPIAEIPVTYLNRDGESKLSVLSDGVGFLLTIIRTKYGKNAAQHRNFN